MTITYPRPLPSARVLGIYFEPHPQEFFAPEEGGRFVSVQYELPSLWHLKLDTLPPSELEFSKWRAFLSSLRGSQRQFYGYDVRRPLPLRYQRGFGDLTRAVSGGAFNGATSSWSVSVARDEITLGAASNQELPVAFNLVEGDYIGLEWDTSKRSLHRVLDDANANGSGVGIWSVEPPVHPEVPAEATVNLLKPNCLMRVTTRDLDAGLKERRVAFEAKQDLEF